MIDLELTQLFIQTIEHGNIAAAARSLGISSSYASRRLNALEKALNNRLLIRTTRSLTLTKAGETYLAFAREIMRRNDELSEDLVSLNSEPTGLVRIATRIFSGQFYLNHSMAAFCKAYPKIKFQVSFLENVTSMLEKGYDIGIDAGPIPDRSVVAQQVYHYKRTICASPDFVAQHALNSDDLTILERLPCLNYFVDASPVWHFLDRKDSLISQKINALVEANSFALLRELALQGVGILSIGEQIVKDDLAAGRLVELFENYHCVDARGRTFSVRLIFPARQIPHRAQLFAKYLERELRKHSTTGVLPTPQLFADSAL